jgi:hypothetical protein
VGEFVVARELALARQEAESQLERQRVQRARAWAVVSEQALERKVLRPNSIR